MNQTENKDVLLWKPQNAMCFTNSVIYGLFEAKSTPSFPAKLAENSLGSSQ
jgi:hypothetical protein